MTYIYRSVFVALIFPLLLVSTGTTWAVDGEVMREPSWKSHDSSKDDDLPGVTEIMVTLKPHARTYVYRHYDWGEGKTSEGYEETMSVSEAQKLSKVAGIELKIKPISLPEGVHILREDEPVNEKELRRPNSIAKGMLIINGYQLLSLPFAMTPKEARVICAKLLKHPDVEYADPNGWGYGDRIPNDTLYIPSQWNLQQSAGGANLPTAWDTNIGGSNIVVAVLDSGILPNHADLLGRTVSGYDFVSDPVLAADGGGRDADPTDPGNWVTQAEVTANPASLNSCVITTGQTMNPSSWHGTHVAGIVGANSNNSIGVAGVNWISKILPVRISGKCGKGLFGDLTAAIQWAAGIPSVIPPTNLNPAKVINISFGGSGACPPAMQSAINAAVKKNVVIVAAAGNDGALASNHWPANCANVVTVGAVNRQGGQSSFTNTGSALSLSAAGGENSGYAIDAITSTGDGGTTTALNNNAYTNLIGTSQAAPHVSGVASLMLSVNSKLTFKQVKYVLEKSARVFPTGTGRDCTSAFCGAGIVDATAAAGMARSRLGGGDGQTFAIQSDGSVMAWGSNSNGQLGNGTSISSNLPLKLLGLTGVKEIDGGLLHSLAVMNDGTVWAWGWNFSRQLGDGTTIDRSSPVQVMGITGAKDIAAGGQHSLALKLDGTVATWGYNLSGQLGVGNNSTQTIVVQPIGLTNVVAIAAATNASYALKDDGTVWAWGQNNIGQIGDGTNVNRNLPTQVVGLTDIIAISAGSAFALAHKSDGTVWAWGDNSSGQLGNGTTTNQLLPIQVTSLTDIASISTGTRHSMAIKSDGTVFAWGDNINGQLGNGLMSNQLLPLSVTSLANGIEIIATGNRTYELNPNGTLTAWGLSPLGDGTTGNSLIPIPVRNDTNSGSLTLYTQKWHREFGQRYK